MIKKKIIGSQTDPNEVSEDSLRPSSMELFFPFLVIEESEPMFAVILGGAVALRV